MNSSPFTDEELGAYLDGELPAARRPAVAAFLASNPDHARRLDAYRTDGEAIARLFANAGEITKSPPAARRQAGRIIAATPWRRAAAIAFLIAGAAASFFWLYGRSTEPSDLARFGGQAAIAYATRPASLTVSLGDVSRLISSSLSSPVTFHDPSASGFRLVGSRAIAGAKSPQVQLVLRNDSGTTITMYLEARPKAEDAPFVPVSTGLAQTTLVWIDDEMACAVSGTLPANELESTARLIYKHLLS